MQEGYNCSLEISKWGREQNPPIDRQAHDTHVKHFLPINFSANFAPQLILKILLVVSITVLIKFPTLCYKNATL